MAMSMHQKRLMARNIYAKYADVTNHEAQRIIDKKSDDAVDQLCEMQPHQAATVVAKDYAHTSRAKGDEILARIAREVDPVLEDEHAEPGQAGVTGGDEPAAAATVEPTIPVTGEGDPNPGLDADDSGESSDEGSVD